MIGGDFKKQIDSAIKLIETENASILSEAASITDFLTGKLPVIYAVDGYNGVATRFRQQINENSKMLCWHNILPEMNHNELVGWASKNENLAVIILRNKTDYSRTQTRLEISKEVFKKYTPNVKELWSKGESQLERTIYLIHLTDHVSVQLAEKRKIDAMEINIINHLKGELAKI
jgi:glucose/mannose-6-phosphate isomerase